MLFCQSYRVFISQGMRREGEERYCILFFARGSDRRQFASEFNGQTISFFSGPYMILSLLLFIKSEKALFIRLPKT